MKKHIFLSFGVVFYLVAVMRCSGQQNTHKKKLTNTYTMTSDLAKQCNLPEIDFSVQYPDDLEVIKPELYATNSSYVVFLNMKKGRKEELDMKWFTGSHEELNFRDFGNVLLNRLKRDILAVDPMAKTVFQGKNEFYSMWLYQFRMRYKVTYKQSGNTEHRKILCVLYPTNNKGGLVLIFQAEAGHKEIKSFSDFGTKGITGQIWKTFTMKE